MDWLNNEVQQQQDELNLLKRIKQLDRLTIYDHNYQTRVNEQQLSFTSIFNCKKISRKYSIMGKIEGHLLTRNIELSCCLVDWSRIVCAKWKHQKLELLRFAAKYNQKSIGGKKNPMEDGESYQIKVNPLNGEFYVRLHFFFSPQFLKDYDKFRMRITDQCEKLGQEAEKVFNTIIEVIFDEQTNEPYLKSDERVGPTYSKPVKVQKLLRKIKKLSMISNHYKIKQELSSISKERSLFKKKYIKHKQRVIHDPLVLESALLYELKFCKKNLESLSSETSMVRKNHQMILPFNDLQDNNEIEFAKHLKDNYEQCQSCIEIKDHAVPADYPREKLIGQQNINGILVNITKPDGQQRKYQQKIVERIGMKHPNLIQYYTLPGISDIKVTQFIEAMPLQQYLQENDNILSLTGRLNIMIQLCNFLQSMHRKTIGCFLSLDNIYITKTNTIKIVNMAACFSVCSWEEPSIEMITRLPASEVLLPNNLERWAYVIGMRATETMNNKDYIEQLTSQRADVYHLGMVLYRVLMGKFPFNPHKVFPQSSDEVQQLLNRLWVADTEYFQRQTGMVGKLLAHLLLKCFHFSNELRPYVDWITVILCEVKSSLESIY